MTKRYVREMKLTQVKALSSSEIGKAINSTQCNSGVILNKHEMTPQRPHRGYDIVNVLKAQFADSTLLNKHFQFLPKATKVRTVVTKKQTNFIRIL